MYDIEVFSKDGSKKTIIRDWLDAELSKRKIYDINLFYLNYLAPTGYYILVYTDEKTLSFIINDFISTFRLYYDPILKKVSRVFEELIADSYSLNDRAVKRIEYSGYTVFTDTVANSIFKVPPNCLVDLVNDRVVLIKFDCSDDTTISLEQVLLERHPDIRTKKVGVAFSGGADSELICEALLRLDCDISLYHMLSENPSQSHVEEYQQAIRKAEKLGLPLHPVQVDHKKLCNSKDVDANDGHKGYVSVRNFLRQLDENEPLDLVLTGQNIDTLCNYGVTRDYHLLDAIQLIIFKIYGPLLKMRSNFHFFLLPFISFIYLYRGLRLKEIPRSWDDFRYGLMGEYTYLPRKAFSKNYYRNKYLCQFIESISDEEYVSQMLHLKLQSHISGNHSAVWSNYSGRMDVDVPYSDVRFLGVYKFSMRSIRNILKPKAKLRKDLLL